MMLMVRDLTNTLAVLAPWRPEWALAISVPQANVVAHLSSWFHPMHRQEQQKLP